MTAERLGYRPGLDAIRAVAVAIVLASHLWGSTFPGIGTHGVTMFFTLSGFLITKLLLEERTGTGKIWWAGFYQRRALRLLPVLPLVIGACAMANHLQGFPVLSPVLTSTFYVHNFAVGWQPQPGAFNIFWSLAVEEQFYLLWPATLWLVTAPRLRRICFWSLPVLLVVRLTVEGTVLGNGFEQSGVTRVDSLLIGAWLAFVVHERRRTVPPLAVWLSVAVVAMWTLTGNRGVEATTWGAGMIGATTCVLIVHALDARRAPAMLVWVGRRSYGIYLWQAPLIWLLLSDHGPVVTLAATLLVAECSYRWVELPFLRRKPLRVADDTFEGQRIGSGSGPGDRVAEPGRAIPAHPADLARNS